MSNIRGKFLDKIFLTESVDIIFRNRRPDTATKYSTHIKQWQAFCSEKQINPVSPLLPKPVGFLPITYKSGVGYSSVATARSSLSS